jgi:uncharacterized membrane protein
MMEFVPADFTTLDRAALAWFLLTWLGYGPLIRALPSPKSITSRMLRVRRAWMHAMLGRDNRITDASLIGHAVHSATFFASTTVVALAALLGVLGNLDRAHTAIGELVFAAKTSHPFLEGKLLLLILVFSHTFLKLSWALRQLNYCVAIIGAAPLKPNPAQRDRIADRTSVVLSLTVSSFNAGIRGYYFALAALAWLLGPAAFVLATSGMAAMLLWRQFGSATSEAIGWGLAALDGEDAVSGRYDTIDRPVYADGA